MQITVKQAVSQVSLEIGLAQAALSQVIGSNDQDVIQMTALLSAVADEVMDEEPYRESLGDGYWLVAADGLTKKAAPTADDDTILFDGRLAVAGVKFRFLQAKGLEYGEPARDFTVRMNKLAGRANTEVVDLYNDEGRIQ
jgi:hypothetical protein